MNSFGTIYRTMIFGESHGESVGVLIDGIPAGIELDMDMVLGDLDRRRSGSRGTTPRKESDTPTFGSGVFEGKTTAAPMVVTFENSNTRSGDYRNLVSHPRPGHSDLVAKQKYFGFNDYRGGGHFSGRVTLGMVVSGSIAKMILGSSVKISSKIVSLAGESNEEAFAGLIENAMKRGDSIGGVIECRVSGVEPSLGSPFFNSVESLISHAIFAIPGVRAIEFGEGFDSAKRFGSEHNDNIISAQGATQTNHAGGINGGITNGNDIVFRVAIKPTSSISVPQDSYNFDNQKVEELIIKGRHDACIALRAGVVIEAAAAMVLADLALVRASEQTLSK